MKHSTCSAVRKDGRSTRARTTRQTGAKEQALQRVAWRSKLENHNPHETLWQANSFSLNAHIFIYRCIYIYVCTYLFVSEMYIYIEPSFSSPKEDCTQTACHGETGHPGDSRSAACCTQWSPADLAASDWCPGSGDDQDVLEGNGQRGERCRVFPWFFPAVFWALNVGCGGHHVS